jgi:cyclase
MLKKRIIPCLDIKDGRTVKGIQFLGLRDAGNPVELARKYAEDGADELVFLDITATNEKRATLVNMVHNIACEIAIPFTVGGGIRTVEDAHNLLQAGADKVSLNSSAVQNPELIGQIAAQLGSQAVVVAIDTRFENNDWYVYINGGKKATGLTTLQWAKQVEGLGAGEILLTSMSNDGTKNGFSISITNTIAQSINIPVIASGGAGCLEDFKHVFTQTGASGALAASVFHFGEILIPQLKTYLKTEQIPVR